MIRRYKTVLSLTGVILMAASYSADAAIVSNPKNIGGNTYENPVIHADYSDPDVVASPDGKTFYMTASSFQCAPGLPILRSIDLVNWDLVNYALPSVPPTDYYDAAPRHGKGVWAPCIRVHEGQYYIYWGDPDFGIFMIRTDNPEGEWSEPCLVKEGKGLIDPSPIWTSDGRAYLANGWAASRSGMNSVITISEMTPDGTSVKGAPVMIFDGNDGVNHTVEGPKMYERDGWYYIFAPAGGVATGWQIVSRSKDIFGPYETRIVMAQGKSDINGPHQGAWVTTEDGEDWFLHFQDMGAYGRVIHLNPVEWRDGWPVIGTDKDGDGCGDPVRKYKKPSIALKNKGKTEQIMLTSDTGVSPYQWHSNYSDLYGFASADGAMRLYGAKAGPDYRSLWDLPNLWLEKFPARSFTFEAPVKISAKGNADGVSSGIVVMGWDYARLGLEKRGDRFVLVKAVCTDAEQGGRETVEEIAEIEPSRVYEAGLYPNMEREITLYVKVGNDGMCRFGYSLDGKKKTDIPGAFKARAGKWIGAKVGYYSLTPAEVSDRGWMDIPAGNVIRQ